jgi:hypothetical protein
VVPKLYFSDPDSDPDSDPALALISDPDSDPTLALIPDPGFGSGFFYVMKNTLEFMLIFLRAQSILRPYLNCRSSKIRI